jgi:hypothetical protein
MHWRETRVLGVLFAIVKSFSNSTAINELFFEGSDRAIFLAGRGLLKTKESILLQLFNQPAEGP